MNSTIQRNPSRSPVMLEQGKLVTDKMALDGSRSIEARAYLERIVSHRWPTLRDRHADLVADALGDLVAWVERLESNPTDEDLRRVAAKILQRRVADHVRYQIRNYAAARVRDIEAASASPERRVLAAQALQIVMEELASLSDEDRRLAFGTMDPDRPPLDATDRKRLERLRERLRDILERRLGVDLDGLTGIG